MKREQELRQCLDERGYLIVACTDKLPIGTVLDGGKMSEVVIIGYTDEDDFVRQLLRFPSSALKDASKIRSEITRHRLKYFHKVVAE